MIGMTPRAPTALHDEQSARDQLGGIGHTKFYELIKTGEIRTVKIGRRTFVTAMELTRFIESLDTVAARDA